ncbi:MAG TPA: cysteine desulfurase family protein [Fibrobacteria bacterium]|nr:cysteine desulfurase family protein [Fibrobacteria bacterium]
MPRIYFDHNATTPLHPEVAAAMAAALGAAPGAAPGFGNPSSVHWAGRESRRLVEDARESLAGLIAVDPAEIVFTSGGTEADNLAILGAAASGRLPGRHLVAASFEHPAVLEAFRKLEAEGWAVTWIDPDGDGVVRAETVERSLRPDTGLASVMAVNNETGAVQPVAAIGSLLRGRGVLFHCDGVQALGKLAETRPREWGADYLSLSAHKINGPKGVGALYVRKGAPLQGLNLGGPQERESRGGTENVPGIIGFGKAAEVWARTGAMERIRLAGLRDSLEAALRARIPDLIVNAAGAPRVPNTLNVTLPGCQGDLLVMGLDMREAAVSAGSACASGSVKYSHVLLAMGKGKEAASSSLRFSLGWGNTEAEIGPMAEAVALVAASVRGM